MTRSTGTLRAQARTALPALAEQREAALRAVLGGSGPDIATQPIVDLHRGVVVGFEALARFPGAAPDLWFAAAVELGLGAALNAHVVRRALARRADLPANTFLSVNLDPTYLRAAEVERAFHDAGDLGGIVVELTEHKAITDLPDLLASIEDLRGKGAKIALDDAGSGYAGLQWLMALRPDVVKLDKALVRDVHRDETTVAMIELLGNLTDRMDAWLLAEGIEEAAQLEALARLGVPLGQGYFLARPALGAWPAVSDTARWLVRARTERLAAGTPLGPLVEDVRTEPAHALPVPDVTTRLSGHVTVLVDAAGRPVRLRSASSVMPVTLVKSTEAVADIVRRAMTRSDATRWDPVVVTDHNGRCLGLVRLERLIEALIPPSPTSIIPSSEDQ